MDNHISCSLPDEDEDQDMHDIVTALQTHKHSQTCKKKNTSCRFFFPRPLGPKTVIARPPDSDTDPVKLAAMENILQAVYGAMMNHNLAESLTLESLLQSAGINVESYIEALQMCTKRHMVILHRKAHEQFVNNYHPLLLQKWRANMDI